MYRDVQQWLYIRSLVLEKGRSRRQVVRETGISRKTVRKMLAPPLPLSAPRRRPDKPQQQTQEEARTQRRRVRAAERQAAQVAAQDWMRRLSHGHLNKTALREELPEIPDLDRLLGQVRTGSTAQRRRALAILG